MHHFNNITYRHFLIGLVIGLVSLAIPLLRDLHWESAGAASLVSAFFAGIVASGSVRNPFEIFTNNLKLLSGWILPLLIFSLITSCFSFDGFAFWVFGPVPSMLFGWSTGRLFRLHDVTNKRFFTVTTLLLVAVLPPVVLLLSYPQLYFFNHVWSYWPGPIYDEIVTFDIRMLGFRGLTILWVFVLWQIPSFFDRRISKLIVLLGLAGIMFTYYHYSSWGFIAPEERIQRQLGRVHETEHFRIFYSSDLFDEEELNLLADQHETYLQEITYVLELNSGLYLDQKIHSYIYSDVEQKKILTGAGQTSYVPVWLNQDQTHIAADALERVLKHELVHIIAKQFGNWFGASNRIGLVEGLAVALAPDRYESTIDQLVAARDDWPEPDEIKELFSFSGFYKTAGPISYVISGSFVYHLVSNYPVELFRSAYRTGNLESSYDPQTFDSLVDSWHAHLDNVEVDAEARQRSLSLFSTPSILQKPCPRVQKQRQLQSAWLWREGVSPRPSIVSSSFSC